MVGFLTSYIGLGTFPKSSDQVATQCDRPSTRRPCLIVARSSGPIASFHLRRFGQLGRLTKMTVGRDIHVSINPTNAPSNPLIAFDRMGVELGAVAVRLTNTAP